MAKIDWNVIEREVVSRIHLMAAIVEGDSDLPDELRSKITDDLVKPNLRLLAEFCANINIESAFETETKEEN